MSTDQVVGVLDRCADRLANLAVIDRQYSDSIWMDLQAVVNVVKILYLSAVPEPQKEERG